MRREPFIALAAASVTVSAAGAFAGNITVRDAWFRALPAGLPAAGYFLLHNAGSAAMELVAAKSPACGMLMIHRSTTSGGMSRMQPVSEVKVPAGGAVEFAPGGYHLMCMKPASEMIPGAHVEVTLVFAGNEEVQVDFAVRSASGK